MTKQKLIALCAFFVQPFWLMAQDKEAVLTLKFEVIDSVKTALVNVTSDGAPVKELEVALYAERLGGQLPIGKSTTDEEGVATFEFPSDLPGDPDHALHVVAKIQENEEYMDTETKADVKWGIDVQRPGKTQERSLSAGRARAPVYFMVVANAIIIGIWGTLAYIVFQLFRLKKLGTPNENNHL